MSRDLLKRWFPGSVQFRRRQRLDRALASTPQVSRDGTLYCGLQDYDTYEPGVHAVLMDTLRGYEVFVNIGANHGIYCLRAASTGKPVFAFEPSYRNFQILLKNVQMNRKEEQIQCYPMALGEKPGVLALYGEGTGASLSAGWNQQHQPSGYVSVSTVDEIMGSRLRGRSTLFLIDVENFEYEVLNGSTSTLMDTARRGFVVEIPTVQFMPDGRFNPHFRMVFEFFFQRGYQAEEINQDGTLHPLTLADVSEIESSRRFNGLMVRFERPVGPHILGGQ